jgi:hypothetical protein
VIRFPSADVSADAHLPARARAPSRSRRVHRHRRAVADVLATLLLVAIVVVLLAVVYVLDQGLTHASSSTPIGSAFAADSPAAANRCTGAGAPTVGCLAANDYYYTLRVEESTVTFASVLFQVKVPIGTVYSVTTEGGFNMLNPVSHTVAAYNLSASGALAVPSSASWVYFPGTGVFGGSSLTNLYTIVIDMGSLNPAGQGYVFVVIGTGSYTGTTSPVALP